jgi:hypothetical protein
VPVERFEGSTPQLDADQGEFGDPAGNTPYVAPGDQLEQSTEATGDTDADGSVYVESEDGFAMASTTAVATGDGTAIVDHQASAEGAGNAQAIINAGATVGEATTGMQATSEAQATTNIGAQATEDDGTALTDIRSQTTDGTCILNLMAKEGATEAQIRLAIIAGATQFLTKGLPTSNPGVAGALWNDTGTLKVSAG